MTTKILEAQLIINAQDKTAKGLEGVVKRIDTVVKSIDNFRKVQARFADARGKFNQAQKMVQDTARAMAATDKPTKAMEANFKSVQRAVSQASKAFDAQKTALIGAKHELESYGVEVTKLAQSQNRLKQATEQASAMQARQAVVAQRIQRLKNFAGPAAGAAGLAAGHYTREGVNAAVKATAEGEHERVRMDVAGMSPAEIREAEELSARLSGEFKSVGQTKILHLLRNARSIVGTYEEAGNIIEPLLKTYVVAQGAHPDRAEELGEDFDKLVKGMEIKGVTQDMPKFIHYLDNMSKALNVFGDTLRPTDYYEMFKYGRQSTQGLSDKYMLQTAPTFAQEMGGSSAGKAFSSFFQAVVGGRMKQSAIQTLEKYGLVDESKVIKTKTGATKGLMPGGIVGADIARTDPYAWVNQVFLPALAKKGVTDPQAVSEIISTAFQAGTAAQLVQILATQQPRIEKDWRLIEGAKGSEAAAIFQSKDPYIGLKSVTEQFTNLLQAAGSPLAATAAQMLNSVASSLKNLTDAAREHPKTAAGALVTTTAAGAVAGGWAAGSLWSRLFTGGRTAAAGSDVLATIGAGAGTGVAVTAAAAAAGFLAGMWPTSGDESDAEALKRRLPEMKAAGAVPAIGGSATLKVEISGLEGLDSKTSLDGRIDGVRVGTTGTLGNTMPEASPAYGGTGY